MTELEYNQATLDSLEKDIKKWDTYRRSSQKMDRRDQFCLLRGQIRYQFDMVGLHCEHKFDLMEGFYKMR